MSMSISISISISIPNIYISISISISNISISICLDPFFPEKKKTWQAPRAPVSRAADGRALGQNADLHSVHLVPDHHRTALRLGAGIPGPSASSQDPGVQLVMGVPLYRWMS